MNPQTGAVFELGETMGAFYPPPEVGQALDMEMYRAELSRLEAMGKSLTDSERAAAHEPSLVLVSGQVAQKLALGEREQERRRKRRKSERASRKRNR